MELQLDTSVLDLREEDEESNDSLCNGKKLTIGGDDYHQINMQNDEFIVEGDDDSDESGRNVTGGFVESDDNATINHEDEGNEDVIEGKIDETNLLHDEFEVIGDEKVTSMQ